MARRFRTGQKVIIKNGRYAGQTGEITGYDYSKKPYIVKIYDYGITESFNSISIKKYDSSTIKELKQGDRIIYIGSEKRIQNETGIIIHIEQYNLAKYGVRFYNNIDGHNLDGRCENGHGWWCDEDELKLIEAQTIQTQTIEESKDEEDMEKVSEQLANIVAELKKTNTYDEVVKDEMINKVRNVSEDKIVQSLGTKVDEYIKNTYGMLPKIIKIENSDGTHKEMSGVFHKSFEQILKLVNKNIPLMLTGPAGAGKNHTLEQVAEALGLDFYFTNAVTQEYKLTGFIDAKGEYQETQFYKAFKNGGLFFLDEIDASCPDSLIVLNSAIANGYFDFPNGRVNAHENFRVVCAGNTFGNGADMIYVGRNQLDGATLDRFAVIQFNYDENVESKLAYDDELYIFIKDLREAISKCGLRYIVSMRATINASKMLEIGMDKLTILKTVILKGMSIDDINTIVRELPSSSWKTEMQKGC